MHVNKDARGFTIRYHKFRLSLNPGTPEVGGWLAAEG